MTNGQDVLRRNSAQRRWNKVNRHAVNLPLLTSSAFQHCCHQLLRWMIWVSISQSSKKANRSFFPLSHGEFLWNWRPPSHGKSRVHCWVGTGSSGNAYFRYIRASEAEHWLLSLWLPDTVQSKQPDNDSSLKSCHSIRLIVHIRLNFWSFFGKRFSLAPIWGIWFFDIHLGAFILPKPYWHLRTVFFGNI